MSAVKVFLLLVCMVYAITQVSAECPTNPECEAGTECCLRVRTNDAAECSPYLPNRANCRTYNTVKDDVYLYSCPCEPDLYCNSRKCSKYRRSIPRSNTTVADTTTPTSTSPAPEPPQ